MASQDLKEPGVSRARGAVVAATAALVDPDSVENQASEDRRDNQVPADNPAQAVHPERGDLEDLQDLLDPEENLAKVDLQDNQDPSDPREPGESEAPRDNLAQRASAGLKDLPAVPDPVETRENVDHRAHLDQTGSLVTEDRRVPADRGDKLDLKDSRASGVYRDNQETTEDQDQMAPGVFRVMLVNRDHQEVQVSVLSQDLFHSTSKLSLFEKKNNKKKFRIGNGHRVV